MTLRGFVKDGVVVLYEPSGLAEGAEVDVRPRSDEATGRRDRPTKRKAKVQSKVGKKSAAPATKVSRKKRASKRKPLTLREVLEKYTGAFDGLPSDLARNHDHYLHGKPKKP